MHFSVTKDCKRPVDKKPCHTEPWQDGCVPFEVGEKVGNTNLEQDDPSQPRMKATSPL
jgi:hypothetical protein